MRNLKHCRHGLEILAVLCSNSVSFFAILEILPRLQCTTYIRDCHGGLIIADPHLCFWAIAAAVTSMSGYYIFIVDSFRLVIGPSLAGGLRGIHYFIFTCHLDIGG